MVANTITIARIVYTFAVIALFGRHPTLDITLIFSIALIFILDAVDGIVARNCNKISEIGALLDTLADRIVENTFWIYFTATGQLPVLDAYSSNDPRRTHRYACNGHTVTQNTDGHIPWPDHV